MLVEAGGDDPDQPRVFRSHADLATGYDANAVRLQLAGQTQADIQGVRRVSVLKAGRLHIDV